MQEGTFKRGGGVGGDIQFIGTLEKAEQNKTVEKVSSSSLFECFNLL